MKNKFSFFIILLISTLLLVACNNSKTPQPQNTSIPSTANSSGAYPAPQQGQQTNSNPAYPPPDDSAKPTTDYVIEVIPTPQSGMGVVTGILKYNRESGIEPVADTLLSLGKVLRDEQGTAMMAQLNTFTELRVQLDRNGRFVFINVPPGEYVLVYDRIIESYMLKDPETGEDFIFSATADQVTDLGELIYNDLPGE